METLLMIISSLLIGIVVLQGAKSESGGNVFSGSNDSLFANRKERGGELFITRLTAFLGLIFLVLSFIASNGF